MGALTIGAFKAFGFEGRRAVQADQGITRLRAKVDTQIVIPNDQLLSVADEQTTVIEASANPDEVLLDGVRGITELVDTRIDKY